MTSENKERPFKVGDVVRVKTYYHKSAGKHSIGIVLNSYNSACRIFILNVNYFGYTSDYGFYLLSHSLVEEE